MYWESSKKLNTPLLSEVSPGGASASPGSGAPDPGAGSPLGVGVAVGVVSPPSLLQEPRRSSPDAPEQSNICCHEKDCWV